MSRVVYGVAGSVVVGGVSYAVSYRQVQRPGWVTMGDQTVAVGPDGVEHVIVEGIARRAAWVWMIELALEEGR